MHQGRIVPKAEAIGMDIACSISETIILRPLRAMSNVITTASLFLSFKQLSLEVMSLHSWQFAGEIFCLSCVSLGSPVPLILPLLTLLSSPHTVFLTVL